MPITCLGSKSLGGLGRTSPRWLGQEVAQDLTHFRASPLPSFQQNQQTWDEWLLHRYPKPFQDIHGQHIPFASFHVEFWQWIWSIRLGVRPRPFIGVWPRGSGKSTNAELGCIALGERSIRKYGIYVCGTQRQADDHVMNIGLLLESPQTAHYAPHMANRKISKYGSSMGWRRNRLYTAGGFIVDAFGLDTASRGAKVEDARPDFIVFDDIDKKSETEFQTLKKVGLLTSNVIPAGSRDVAILGVQNLIFPGSVFSRLLDGRADFLSDKIVSGPHKALEGLAYEKVGNITTLKAGTSLWPGFTLPICQGIVNSVGINAFRAEYQHETVSGEGAMFGDVWQEGVHVIPAFTIPHSWKIYRAFDWGFGKPFAFGWWAVSDGTEAPNGRCYPKGTMIHIKEFYGWNGKPNEGMRIETREMGKRARVIEERLEQEQGHVVQAGPADSSIFDTISGVNYADQLAESKLHFVRSNKKPGSRHLGAKICYDRLLASTKQPMEEKGLFVFECCTQWRRTVPGIPKDLKDPDDVATNAEDHCYDKTRYMALFCEETSGTVSLLGT